MGYTHYFQQTRDFTEEQMRDIIRQVKRIIKEATGKTTDTAGHCYPDVPVKICGYDGTGVPELTTDYISFNGEAPFDHETFYFKAKRELESWQTPDRLGWAFCKTARKPYDVVVTACLTFLAADYGFDVSSDGDMEDWEAGVALAEKALGRQFANPMVVEQLVR